MAKQFKVIIHKMGSHELRDALEKVQAYLRFLEEVRNHNNKPVFYGEFSVHETKTGTVVVKKRTD